MVVPSQWVIGDSHLLAQAARKPTLLEQLTPLNQLRVIVGLVVVLVLGVVIFLIIKAGAHMVKGYAAAARRLPSDSSPDEVDWTQRPLSDPEADDE